MSVNKTIGGLSVLSSANIKGCYSLAVWDSDAQTTKSACITDVLGGAGGSSIFVEGAGASSSIRCGVNNTATGAFSASLGGQNNCATACQNFIGGGQCNRTSATRAAIMGGDTNTASGDPSFIGGGFLNVASAPYTFIGGGGRNLASCNNAFIGAGFLNCSTGCISLIAGGCNNSASGYFSAIVGGGRNKATNVFSSVVNGTVNCSSGCYSSIINGYSNCASGTLSFINGRGSSASGYRSTILNGSNHRASGQDSLILSGQANCVDGCYASIMSGELHCAVGYNSFVINGYCNKSLSAFGGIVSGSVNCIIGLEKSFILNGECNKIVDATGSGYAGFANSILGGCCNSLCTNCGTTSGYDACFQHNLIVSGSCNIIRAVACGTPFADYNFILGGTRSCITITDSSSNVYSSVNTQNSILSIGNNNCITNAVGVATDPNMDMTLTANSILSGSSNRVTSSFVNPTNNLSNNGSLNVIVGGCLNTISINDSLSSPNQMRLVANSVVSGITNCIFHTCFSFGCNSSILTGQTNRLCSTTNASILGGCANTISFSCSNAIVGGAINTISSVNCSMAFGQSNVVAHNYVGVVGCGITSVIDCALHANRVVVTNMPTSSAGLPSGTLWSDAGTIKIIP